MKRINAVDTCLYFGLDAQPRRLRGAVVEPALGYALETFATTWRKAHQVIRQQILAWTPHYRRHDFTLVVCLEDSWPSRLPSQFKDNWPVRWLDREQVDDVLDQTARLLNRCMRRQRPELMAFIARNFASESYGSDCITNRKVAAAWAVAFARQQLLDVELEMASPDYSDWPPPVAELERRNRPPLQLNLKDPLLDNDF
jgi:hypothetical protein